ncbi:hypothetical protein JB92DRAFT_2234114 [Gautieria morchelliformis]|nr:hypothetical protein JB92DRAFT_2234114 [Gautieria morchelliformis]
MGFPAVHAVLFVLQLLGFVSLSALLFTIVLSDSENMRRHSVFFNFVWTYLMYTAVMIFTCVLSDLLNPRLTAEALRKRDVVLYMAFTQASDETIGVDMILNTLVNSMRLVALTATLNLVIHLWFQMRGAFSDAKAWTTKLRTFALLVTPYAMGIVPLVVPAFWHQPNTQQRSAQSHGLRGSFAGRPHVYLGYPFGGYVC